MTTRRDFLELLGASIALAGVGGCFRRPSERILPYVTSPELTPGIPQYYATAMELDGFATGLLVESHEGRPTKVEGNPDHPASLGATGVFEQASVLGLYDPARARAVARRGGGGSWAELAAALAPGQVKQRVGARGAGLRLLMEPTASPLLDELVNRVRALYPAARLHVAAPCDLRTLYAGTALAFGRPLQPVYDLANADVILALDADLLAAGPFNLRYAHDFAERRRLRDPAGVMSRLYVAESTPTPTGSLADHRLRVRALDVVRVLAAVVAELAGDAAAAAPLRPVLERLRDPATRAWALAAASDLRQAGARALVVAGPRQPAEVQALAQAANTLLGSVGTTVRYIAPLHPALTDAATALPPLAEALGRGEARTVLVLGGNPAYTAPADLELGAALARAETVRLGPYRDETAGVAAWFVPELHYLERWGDARAYDGTTSIVQPLVAPLHGGWTAADLLGALLGEPDRPVHARLQELWRGRTGAAGFAAAWDEALRRGVVAGPAATVTPPAPRWGEVARALELVRPPAPAALELVLPADPKVHDGRWANNAWLQELPEPVTKLTWDNAALLSPATAAHLAVATGDVVELRLGGRRLRAPVFVLPGQADGSVTLRLGYGRGGDDETLARGVGADAYRLRLAAAPYAAAGLEVTAVTEGGAPARHALATTQAHWSMEGRDPVAYGTLADFRRAPATVVPPPHRQLTIYQPPGAQAPDQWAMAIDLGLCTGCSACVVACQAENNVPVVGKAGVLKSREMHWLRIDRYFAGTAEEPVVLQQPMLCQHCEKAPCEYVCPVGATTHSPDGINEMTYNRCVGTRFCSNNCPYKVRRFNWFDYSAEIGETVALVKNPDVTVRARGVMEKCTFCVQRVREHGIARELGRDPPPVRTACMQACPTGAIVFGSLTDPGAEVTRLRRDARSYAVLDELGTEPRVRYLARLANPNPALAAPADGR